MIDTLPTELRPVYKSLVSAELTLLSRVVNSGVSAATGTSGNGAAGGGGSGTHSKNAAPTSGMVKAAGVAAGAFAVAVVML